MTIGVPISLIDMRAALRERTQLAANDPRGTDAALNRQINFAMHRWQIANPHGWPWDFSESSTTLTIGVDTVTYSLGMGAGAPTKIRYAVLRHPSGLWEYPLERMTRADQLERWPLDSEGGGPRAYSLMGTSGNVGGVLGVVLKLRPKPDIAYSLLIGAQTPGADLAADTDPNPAVNDYMIGDWIDPVLDYAAHLIYRSREDLAEAVGSRASFDEAVLETRRTVRLVMGAGRGGNPLADDRELQ